MLVTKKKMPFLSASLKRIVVWSIFALMCDYLLLVFYRLQISLITTELL